MTNKKTMWMCFSYDGLVMFQRSSNLNFIIAEYEYRNSLKPLGPRKAGK